MRGQYVRGTVLISGPSADALAATDPLVQDDQTSIEVIEWDVHQILGIGSFDPPLVLQPNASHAAGSRASVIPKGPSVSNLARVVSTCSSTVTGLVPPITSTRLFMPEKTPSR